MDNKKLSDKTRKEIKQLKADLKSRDERYAKNLREIINDQYSELGIPAKLQNAHLKKIGEAFRDFGLTWNDLYNLTQTLIFDKRILYAYFSILEEVKDLLKSFE